MSPARSRSTREVDEYLAEAPPEMRGLLATLRETVRAAAPQAEEVISYQMPAFRHHGMLLYYAAFRDHCSLFLGSQLTQRRFASELTTFTSGKGTIRFTPERPLPRSLVTRMVKARVAENESRAKLGPRRAKKRRPKRSDRS
jgi:uncharacterized protein YdhG (YjbR/CyaY superfamily)